MGIPRGAVTSTTFLVVFGASGLGCLLKLQTVNPEPSAFSLSEGFTIGSVIQALNPKPLTRPGLIWNGLYGLVRRTFRVYPPGGCIRTTNENP